MILLIELARGIAALWVVLFHLAGFFETTSPLIYSLSKHGSLGVPMFFVISGYVITYSAESSIKANKSPIVFLKNRFLRIYPTFWASVVLILIIPYIMESISYFKSGDYKIPDNILSKLNFIEWTNLLLLTKVFWASSSNIYLQFEPINIVYWTLAIEFQFYVIIFIALLFRKYYHPIILLITLLAILNIFKPINLNYGLFINYWPSFSVGIALAYLHKNNLIFKLNHKNILYNFILFFVSVALFITSTEITLNNNLLFSLFFGTFLWLVSDLEKYLTIIKNGKNKLLYYLLEPWLILGSMSYSVYLLHGKINQIPEMIARQFFSSSNILYGLSILLGTLLICFPFYYYIESRFLSKKYKKIHHNILKKPLPTNIF